MRDIKNNLNGMKDGDDHRDGRNRKAIRTVIPVCARVKLSHKIIVTVKQLMVQKQGSLWENMRGKEAEE